MVRFCSLKCAAVQLCVSKSPHPLAWPGWLCHCAQGEKRSWLALRWQTALRTLLAQVTSWTFHHWSSCKPLLHPFPTKILYTPTCTYSTSIHSHSCILSCIQKASDILCHRTSVMTIAYIWATLRTYWPYTREILPSPNKAWINL